MQHDNNSLEAIFHRQIKRPLTKTMQGKVMGAFRKAVEIYQREGDGNLSNMETSRESAQNSTGNTAL